jgi:creatinine amidohydrolase/Fe(II)-dependent formamide hydrolase-like protein
MNTGKTAGYSIFRDTMADMTFPEVARAAEKARGRALGTTDFGLDDITEWRKGGEHSLRKTPQGYLGDPAASEPEFGEALMAAQADLVAAAIADKLRRD